MKRALVLGGGGVAGVAWETGLLAGLADEGVDLRNADLFVGTSAGSVVAAQVTTGLELEELYQRQVDPVLQSKELPATIDLEKMTSDFTRILQESPTFTEVLRGIGALALATPTVSEGERRAVIESRLPVQSWPQSRLMIVAVDAHSGERVVFEQASGVGLVDAVGASCAVPGVWPPVSIQEHRYIDGGVYSVANADLTAGFERVLVIQPDVPSFPQQSLEEQTEHLRSAGAQVEIIRPDEAMQAALASVGGNSLDPSIRGQAALAGRNQGRSLAAQVAAFWQ